MDSFVLMLIAITAFTCIKGDDEQIEIYEIRKVKDGYSNDIQDDDDTAELRVDDQYFDPDEFDRIKYAAIGSHKNRKNSKINLVTNNLLDKLRRIVKSGYISKRKEDDDYISSYKDLKDENIFENNGKTPVVIVADRSALYHILPKKSRMFKNNLQSALRSVNDESEVEDRTAPPRIKIHYDYEYD